MVCERNVRKIHRDHETGAASVAERRQKGAQHAMDGPKGTLERVFGSIHAGRPSGPAALAGRLDRPLWPAD
jgi:hypothetical protein